ncbi:MAG: hypothetical protein MPJ24_05590 [Pirellulaceae bacterium]|nr:hypothetical protein [Pirellulaceae bacterium]
MISTEQLDNEPNPFSEEAVAKAPLVELFHESEKPQLTSFEKFTICVTLLFFTLRIVGFMFSSNYFFGTIPTPSYLLPISPTSFWFGYLLAEVIAFGVGLSSERFRLLNLGLFGLGIFLFLALYILTPTVLVGLSNSLPLAVNPSKC